MFCQRSVERKTWPLTLTYEHTRTNLSSCHLLREGDSAQCLWDGKNGNSSFGLRKLITTKLKQKEVPEEDEVDWFCDVFFVFMEQFAA